MKKHLISIAVLVLTIFSASSGMGAAAFAAEPPDPRSPDPIGGGSGKELRGVALFLAMFVAILIGNFIWVKRVDRQESEEKRRISGRF